MIDWMLAYEVKNKSNTSHYLNMYKKYKDEILPNLIDSRVTKVDMYIYTFTLSLYVYIPHFTQYFKIVYLLASYIKVRKQVSIFYISTDHTSTVLPYNVSSLMNGVFSFL